MSLERVSVKPDDTNQPAEAQRRANIRYRCSPATLGRLFVANSYKSVPAWVLNLSTTGIGLQLDRPLEVGTVVLLEIDSPTLDLSVEVGARVVQSMPPSSPTAPGSSASPLPGR